METFNIFGLSRRENFELKFSHAEKLNDMCMENVRGEAFM